MKVHFFYLRGDGAMSARLYAFTDKKDLKKKFEETRDMSKFVVTTHDVKKNDFLQFEVSNEGMRLTEESLKTKTERFGEVGHIDLVMTQIEIEKTLFSNNIAMLIASNLPDVQFLKDRYIKALHFMNYFDFYSLKDKLDWSNPFDVHYRNYPGLFQREMGELNLTFDEYEVFMIFFGDYMKA